VPLFGVDIAGKIARSLGPKLLPATLIKVIPGSRARANLAGGVHATTTEHTARGVVETYQAAQVDGAMILRGDRRVLLLAGTIADGEVPAPGDRIEIEGGTYSVVGVERDPAGAQYSCHVRAV
jgi:hypothetical protein